MSHLMLTGSRLRKRWKQSIRECWYVLSSCGGSGKWSYCIWNEDSFQERFWQKKRVRFDNIILWMFPNITYRTLPLSFLSLSSLFAPWRFRRMSWNHCSVNGIINFSINCNRWRLTDAHQIVNSKKSFHLAIVCQKKTFLFCVA